MNVATKNLYASRSKRLLRHTIKKCAEYDLVEDDHAWETLHTKRMIEKAGIYKWGWLGL